MPTQAGLRKLKTTHVDLGAQGKKVWGGRYPPEGEAEAAGEAWSKYVELRGLTNFTTPPLIPVGQIDCVWAARARRLPLVNTPLPAPAFPLLQPSMALSPGELDFIASVEGIHCGS